MDVYCAYSYIGDHNMTSLNEIISPWINDNIYVYAVFAQFALSFWFYLAGIVSAYTDKFYANGYLQVCVLPGFLTQLWKCGAIIKQKFNLAIDFHSPENDNIFIHFGYTLFPCVYGICTLQWLLSHYLYLIDKDPYNGYVGYYIVFTVMTALVGYLYYFASVPYKNHAELALTSFSGLSLLFSILIALSLLFIAVFCFWRKSVKKFYKPAAFVLLSVVLTGTSLYFGMISIIFYLETYCPPINRDMVVVIELVHMFAPTIFIVLCILFFPTYRNPIQVVKFFNPFRLLCCRKKNEFSKWGYPVASPHHSQTASEKLSVEEVK